MSAPFDPARTGTRRNLPFVPESMKMQEFTWRAIVLGLVMCVMVEDPELPFPESVAASEIHKAGQAGARAAKYLFYNIGFGAAVYLGGVFNLFAPDRDFFFRVGQLGSSTLRLGPIGSTRVLTA